jgi:hypothetical protein
MDIISSVTPEMAKAGVLVNVITDLLSGLCRRCDTEEDALFVAKRVVELGYDKCTSTYTLYCDMFERKRWRLVYFCEKKKFFGRFDSVDDFCIQTNHSPYPYEYYAFLSRESAARNASVALIGVGRQWKRVPGASDAMRVIARVVYSGWQLEEAWEISPAPAPAAAKRRRERK